MSYEEKLNAVNETYPNYALGSVYRFDAWSNFITFEEWIEKKYEELKK